MTRTLAAKLPLPFILTPLVAAPLFLVAIPALGHSGPGSTVPICGERVHVNQDTGIINTGARSYGVYPSQARARCGEATPAPSAAPSSRGQAVANFALAQVGDRYRWGGTGPNAWDCSGLVQAAYRSVGVTLPRVSVHQARVGRRIPVSQAQPGDIVVYPGHVAIAIGGGKQVAASNPRSGVRVQAIYRGARFAVRV